MKVLLGCAFKGGGDPVGSRGSGIEDLIHTTEVTPVVAHGFHLRAEVGGGEGIEQTLDEGVGHFNGGVGRNVTSRVHHQLGGGSIGQIESDLKSGFLVFAVRVEVPAIHAEERVGSAARTSGDRGYSEFVAERVAIVAHRPVTVGDSSHGAFGEGSE